MLYNSSQWSSASIAAVTTPFAMALWASRWRATDVSAVMMSISPLMVILHTTALSQLAEMVPVAGSRPQARLKGSVIFGRNNWSYIPIWLYFKSRSHLNCICRRLLVALLAGSSSCWSWSCWSCCLSAAVVLAPKLESSYRGRVPLGTFPLFFNERINRIDNVSNVTCFKTEIQNLTSQASWKFSWCNHKLSLFFV